MTVDIANRLVELRKKHGYSQEQLAEALGLSRQAVSKWERAEASPDTDNLIMLSRLYGVSLDELLSTDAEDESVRGEKTEDDDERKKTYVNIGWKGIHVRDDEDEVHVGWKGVHVEDREGHKVHVGRNGVYVDEDFEKYSDGREHVVVNGVDYADPQERRRHWLLRVPVAIVALIAFVLVSFRAGSAHPAWMILLAIPVLESLFSAIHARDAHRFAYPVLAVIAFLYMGFAHGLWHPGWVVFLTIPIYYSVLPPSRGRRVFVRVGKDDGATGAED